MVSKNKNHVMSLTKTNDVNDLSTNDATLAVELHARSSSVKTASSHGPCLPDSKTHGESQSESLTVIDSVSI